VKQGNGELGRMPILADILVDIYPYASGITISELRIKCPLVYQQV